jgi:septal ring factor EnvC (AmiA/AmiB activator)
MGKILIIVSIVLAAASAGVGFLNRSNLLKTKEDLAASQQETVTVKASLDGEVKKYVEADKAITELKAQKLTLDSDLAKQKNELGTKTTQLAEIQSKLTKAEADLALAETDKLSKAEKITQLEAQVAAAATVQQTPVPSEEDKARIAELETLNAKLDEDNKNLEGKLVSLQKAAREKETKQSLTRVTGRVLAVNQAWNFVVLSLGNKSGIESNMEFLVKRGSTLIGKVRTTTVEPATSIADIIPASLARGLSIQPGDDIIYQIAQN